MSPDLVPHVARRLMEMHGLIQAGWQFRLDHSARRAGVCRYGRKIIALSRHYVRLNAEEREDDVVDTILHEIAHALVGHGHGHDEVWRDCCLRIGAKPQRCYDPKVVAMPKGRFVATCGGCGRVFRRHRQLRRDRWSHCAACGPERGRLRYVHDAQVAITDATPPAPQDHQSPPPAPLR